MKMWLVLLLFAVIAGADCGNSSHTAHSSPEIDRGTVRGDQLSHRREELSPTSKMKAQETGPSKEEKQQEAKKGKPQHLKEDDDPPRPKGRDYETDAVYVLTMAVAVLVVCMVVVLIIRCRLQHGTKYPGCGFTEARAMDDFERRHSSPEDLHRSRHHRQRVAGSERLTTIPAERHHRQGSRDHPYHLRQERNDGPLARRHFFPCSFSSPGYERVWTSSQYAQTHGPGFDDCSTEIEFSQRGGEEDRRAREMLARLCERFEGGLEEKAWIIDALINEYCVQRAEYRSAMGRNSAIPVWQQYDVYDGDLGQYVHTVSQDVPADAFEDHHHHPRLAADMLEEEQDDHWWVQQQTPPPEYERRDGGVPYYTVVRDSPPPCYSWTLRDDHLEERPR